MTLSGMNEELQRGAELWQDVCELYVIYQSSKVRRGRISIDVPEQQRGSVLAQLKASLREFNALYDSVKTKVGI
jgi:hypothetical protein